MPVGKPGKVPAKCHPERDHWSRGMCASCYQTWWRKENPERYKARKRTPAKCHPDKPVLAKGLCEVCYRAKWREENPERSKEMGRETYHRATKRDPTIRRVRALRVRAYRYGMKPEELIEFLAGKSCQGCGSTEPLSIDHCHDTGRIRGVLCVRCNTMLGNAKDNPEVLLNLVRYLASDAAAGFPDVWRGPVSDSASAS